MNPTATAFDTGHLLLPSGDTAFADLPWNPHPAFPGVTLKHLVSGPDTGGRFSYHLVRIDPDHAIGLHRHATQLETHEVIDGAGQATNDGVTLDYAPGVVSIVPSGVEHGVTAGPEGLVLLSKFIPALS
jgi:quercetin dioxygenase-like cupin family protein